MTRLSETSPSSSLDKRDSVYEELPKSQPNFLQKMGRKLKELTSSTFSKAMFSIIAIVVFSWFGLNAGNMIVGAVSVLHGDFSGFSMMAKSVDIKSIIKESYQVARGFDYEWLKYKKDTGIDLHKDFVYVGGGHSIMRSTVTVKQVALESCEEAYENARDSEKVDMKASLERAKKFCNSKAMAMSLDEAKEFCSDNYGAQVPTHKEMKDIIGGLNPVTASKLDKSKEYPEITSTLNDKDDDEFKIYFKNEKQKKFIFDTYQIKARDYIDDDSVITPELAFRCIKKF